MHPKSGGQLGDSSFASKSGRSHFGLEFGIALSSFIAHVSIFRLMLTQSLAHGLIFVGPPPGRLLMNIAPIPCGERRAK
jgi:hypothetical protein